MNLENLNKGFIQYLVYCAGGYRSMISITNSIKNGFKKLINISSGYGAMRTLVKSTGMLRGILTDSAVK